MRIQYIGHAGFRLELGGLVLFIDPFFGPEIAGRPVEVKCAWKPSDVKECDLIFITHEHSDHCDKQGVQEIVERTFAQVVAPKPALQMLSISERNKVDVHTGDAFELKGLGVEVVKAVHPQSAYPVGFIIKHGKESVYHAGDTYEFADMRDFAADVAMVPIGGSYTMDPFDAGKAVNEMKAKYVIPMHYNTFEKIRQDAREFAGDVKRAKVLLMEVGQEVEL